MPYGTEAFGNVNGEEISLQFIGATEDKHWLFPFVKQRLFGNEPVTETECKIEKEGDLRLEIVGKGEAEKERCQMAYGLCHSVSTKRLTQGDRFLNWSNRWPNKKGNGAAKMKAGLCMR